MQCCTYKQYPPTFSSAILWHHTDTEHFTRMPSSSHHTNKSIWIQSFSHTIEGFVESQRNHICNLNGQSSYGYIYTTCACHRNWTGTRVACVLQYWLTECTLTSSITNDNRGSVSYKPCTTTIVREIQDDFELCIVILLCIISGLNWYGVHCHTSWNSDIQALLLVVNVSCSSGMEKFNIILLHNH